MSALNNLHTRRRMLSRNDMAEGWSREEVEIIVADYFDMLACELRNRLFNKADHNRGLQQILPLRTRGSIERKHQNISAVLLESGYPYVEGYKPLSNYQQLLRDVVEARLATASDVETAVANAVTAPTIAPPTVDDILAVQVDAPSGERPSSIVNEPRDSPRPAVRRDYLAIEARNHSLGRAGEQFVSRFEHERLWRAGQKRLAERVEVLATTRGDNLGYDILSFEVDGRERLIEVKTTQFGPMTPFFASKHEVVTSETEREKYQLYRLFRFRRDPKLFILPGALGTTCVLHPVQFSAVPA